MSTASKRSTRVRAALLTLLVSGSFGCWEQWSETWFPQMKWQRAIQAYEEVTFEDQIQGFVPPEGTVPIAGGPPWFSNVDDPAADALVNPRPMSLESLENGRDRFAIYCAACHGSGGEGDGPVSMTGNISGPIAAVLAIAGPASIAKIRSDGHIYTTIRQGRRRMPSYRRIASDDRWDIVNYIRYINGQKGVSP